MIFSHLLDQFKAHAMSEYPKESCGIVSKGQYIPCDNLADNPLESFTISPRKILYRLKKNTLEGIIHSHPEGPEYPSVADMKGQIDTAVPWMVIPCYGPRCSEPFYWGSKEPPPLMARPFRHGVTDCYSAIQDWYLQERNIELLPGPPREWGWWSKGSSLYTDNFKAAGFRRIDRSEVRRGDVLLMQIRSPTPNHGGVYVGGGKIYHHLSSLEPYDPTRVSGVVPLGSWQRLVSHWLRYEK